MTLEAPTNCWTKAQASIITALANSARYREIAEASSVDAALEKIFTNRVQNPHNGHAYTLAELQHLKHYAQVHSSEEGPYGYVNSGNGRLLYEGIHVVHIARMVTDLESNTELPAETERWFENRVGDLMTQVENYMRENSGPRVKSMIISHGPGENDRKSWKEHGRWQLVDITVSWGYGEQ